MIRRFSLTVCMCLVSIGIWSQDKTHYSDGADDVLQHLPMAAALVIKTAGVESKSDWNHFLMGAGASYALTVAMTYSIKHTIKEKRPDGTDHRSMPSGHSAFAFSGATVLHKEFGHVSPWISVAGFSVATFTAVDRVARNHHYWYDAVAGAGIGILSTELGYWLTDKLFPSQKSRLSVCLAPDGMSLSLNW